jgi:hypothetical protein
MASIGNNLTTPSVTVNPPEYSGAQNVATPYGWHFAMPALKFASDSLRNDREIVLAAILMGESQGAATQYAWQFAKYYLRQEHSEYQGAAKCTGVFNKVSTTP